MPFALKGFATNQKKCGRVSGELSVARGEAFHRVGHGPRHAVAGNIVTLAVDVTVVDESRQNYKCYLKIVLKRSVDKEPRSVFYKM